MARVTNAELTMRFFENSPLKGLKDAMAAPESTSNPQNSTQQGQRRPQQGKRSSRGGPGSGPPGMEHVVPYKDQVNFRLSRTVIVNGENGAEIDFAVIVRADSLSRCAIFPRGSMRRGIQAPAWCQTI